MLAKPLIGLYQIIETLVLRSICFKEVIWVHSIEIKNFIPQMNSFVILILIKKLLSPVLRDL